MRSNIDNTRRTLEFMIINSQVVTRMDDQNLLNFYLHMREKEAYQWNLSPASLYLELETRDF